MYFQPLGQQPKIALFFKFYSTMQFLVAKAEKWAWNALLHKTHQQHFGSYESYDTTTCATSTLTASDLPEVEGGRQL